MRIGLDLDGTIVVYDEIFHRQAVGRLDMPAEVPVRKEAVRAWVRGLPEGERSWIELQGVVYGPLMAEAPAAPGVFDFLEGCRRGGVDVSIVSHRTPYSVARPQVDLHASALGWLKRQGILSTRYGLSRDRVFLEPTRAAKLARISTEGCALFVDDLDELFAEPSFPPAAERWLYSPGELERVLDGVTVFSDWSVVLARVLAVRGSQPDV